MNKLFSSFNFFIFLAILILGSIAHLMYGHSQTSKFHFMVQYHYMPDYLPKWMLKYDRITFFRSVLNDDFVIDKNYSGKWSVWYESGAKYYEAEYKQGVRNGKYISYYQSGAIMEEREFKDDMQIGKWIIWYESGAKKYEGEFKDGKQNGKATRWDTKGKKMDVEEWKDGKMIELYLAPSK